MRPLSATEAIKPAIEHTRAMLRPFSLGLWFKLGLVGVFAELGGQFFFSFPPVGNQSRPAPQSSGIAAIAAGITPLLVAVLIGVAVFSLLLALALFYLGSRLQLVLIDLVATRTTLVGAAWNRTASRTWRWIGGKVLFFLVLLLAAAAVAAAPIFYFIRALSAAHGQFGAASIAAIIFFCIAVLFVVLVIGIASWVLRDFALPFILFEDASFSDALSRAFALMRNQPGAVFFYLFIKLVLSLVTGIAAQLCILVAMLASAVPTGLLGFILWGALHHSGTFGTVMMYCGFAVLALIFAAALFIAAVCISGAVFLFYQAYALYFIGGRIPQVGVLLDPVPPPYYPPLVPAAAPPLHSL
jgi:hypothetical protein